MNHQAIIEQLSQLAPQLKSASSAEDVLIKYAKAQNLSPAQLERIGQVYNIAKTLNFMDKSANRGDSFRVVDTEQMLADFTKHTPADKSKEANTAYQSWIDKPSDMAKAASSPDDLASWIDTPKEEVNSITSYLAAHKKANSMPDIMALARGELNYSVEADVENPNADMDAFRDLHNKQSFISYEIDVTGQIVDDANHDLLKLANELLEMHRIANLPFATMERDAVYSSENPEAIKKATSIIADYFEQKGWKLDRYDFSQPAPRLVHDKHNALPLFKSAALKLDLRKAAADYIEHLNKEAAQAREAREPKRRAGEDTGDTINLPKDNARRRPQDQEQGDMKFPGVNNKRRPKAEEEAGPISQLDYLRMLATQNKDSKPSGNGDGKQDYSAAADIAKGIKSMYDPATYTNSQTQGLIDSISRPRESTRMNTRQRSVDVGADDVSRVADLQRLIMSDPIIGEADPDMVVDLYNTISRANPEIARDKNLLRFALREAIQYEAVPLHTYKDLMSIGKDRVDIEDKTNKLQSARYAI